MIVTLAVLTPVVSVPQVLAGGRAVTLNAYGLAVWASSPTRRRRASSGLRWRAAPVTRAANMPEVAG